MIVLNENDAVKIIQESREALRKLNEYKNTKRKITLKDISETVYRATVGQELFESFDLKAWEDKVRVDALYFDSLLSKLDENTHSQIYPALGSYFRTIRKIYEHVNIKPEIYGKGITAKIFELSNNEVKQKILGVIFEYLDRNFYNLHPSSRESKYGDKAKELAKDLITEGYDSDTAISFAIKSVIIENLLTRIAFPFSIYSRIKYLTESEDYGSVFDQETLVNLVDKFEKQAHSLAKVVAAVV